jgi:hypothetical protein
MKVTVLNKHLNPPPPNPYDFPTQINKSFFFNFSYSKQKFESICLFWVALVGTKSLKM